MLNPLLGYANTVFRCAGPLASFFFKKYKKMSEGKKACNAFNVSYALDNLSVTFIRNIRMSTQFGLFCG